MTTAGSIPFNARLAGVCSAIVRWRLRHAVGGKGNLLVRFLGLSLLVTTMVVGMALAPVGVGAEEPPSDMPQLVGKQAIVIDADTGVILYAKNANERVAPASLTKLFTALVAVEATPPQRRMTVTKDDLVGEASAGLTAGENLSFNTLLHGMLLASGNDAAMAIARNVGTSESPASLDGVDSFLRHTNQRLAELGMQDTHLANPHGLDAADHYSTARDIAAVTMLELHTEPNILAAIASPGYVGEGHKYAQTNQLIGNYPGAIGGKAGITVNAGYCLMAIANRDGHTLISVVLGSTSTAWYNDARMLLDQGFATLAMPDYAGGKPTIALPNTAQATLLSTSPAVAGNLTVHGSEFDTANVRATDIGGQSSWDTLRWPVGAALVMIAAIVCAIQTRAFVELQKRPYVSGMRPRTRRARPATPSRPGLSETQPFTVVSAWERSHASSDARRRPPAWSGSIGD